MQKEKRQEDKQRFIKHHI